MVVFNTSLSVDVPDVSIYKDELYDDSYDKINLPLINNYSNTNSEIFLDKFRRVSMINSSPLESIVNRYTIYEHPAVLRENLITTHNNAEILGLENGHLSLSLLDSLNKYQSGAATETYHTYVIDETMTTTEDTDLSNDGKDEMNGVNIGAFDKDKRLVKSGTTVASYYKIVSARSLFNPYYSVKSKGLHSNLPLLDNLDRNKYEGTFAEDVSDCSILKLLELSAQYDEKDYKHNIMGFQFYRLADFMYCKNLGKVPNNRMITLRRYAAPIGDNIYGGRIKGSGDHAYPDVGRMITWFGVDDNKLSDIFKFDFNASWKEMNAEIQQMESQADSNQNLLGFIGNFNKGYLTSMGQGRTGSHNPIASLAGGALGLIPMSAGTNGDLSPQGINSQMLWNYDAHKIYEPKNTIRSNHYYEGNLTFSNEFTLNFSYKLNGYSNINGKSAFLDLLSNILTVTYTKGTFWGGEQKLIGPKQNDSFYKVAHSFVDNAFDKLTNFNYASLTSAETYKNLLGAFSDKLGKLIGGIGAGVDAMANSMDKATTGENSGSGNDKKTDNSKAATVLGFTDPIAKKMGFQNTKDAFKTSMFALAGATKNALGRPAMYAFNSLVQGGELGLWHVTVGNPRNPILCMGNLIVTNTNVTAGDTPLGLDDFITEFKVSVTLKHCKPRDMFDIQRMFTKGEGSIYHTLGKQPMDQSEFYKDKLRKLDDDNKDNYDKFELPKYDSNGQLAVNDNGTILTEENKYLKFEEIHKEREEKTDLFNQYSEDFTLAQVFGTSDVYNVQKTVWQELS